MMYSLNEIGLIPKSVSKIQHRSEVSPYLKGHKLPIFVSPMTCILDSNNFKIFNDSAFIPIMPVTKDNITSLALTEDWQALTLSNFVYWFNSQGDAVKDYPYSILIDCANGHMEALFDAVKEAKKTFPQIRVMTGNIANPDTYFKCCEAGIDFVRVGIGGGNGCTTSVQTGIHASLPWIIRQIEIRKKNPFHYACLGEKGCMNFKRWIEEHNYTKTKIVADGGIDTIDKAIKCLALGADYVMMGKCFAQCEEACGKTKPLDTSGDIPQKGRKYYGQSSTQGQLDRFGKIKSNSEGAEYYIKVLESLQQLEYRFTSALRSCMSYCNAKNLKEFIGKIEWEYMSQTEFNLYNK